MVSFQEIEIEIDDRADSHQFLLDVAGWLPDAVIARARTRLAEDDLTAMAQTLAVAALATDLPLAGNEVELLEDLIGEDMPELLGLVRPNAGARIACCAYEFGSAPTADEIPPDPDDVDRAAVDAARAGTGIAGLWRVWRRLPGGRTPGVRVYLAEVDENPIGVTGALQRALDAAGETPPRIEVYRTGMDLAAYQRIARDHGTLMWARDAAAEIDIADLYDEVDQVGGPGFAAEHPTLSDEAERGRVVAYLDAGAALLLTPARIDDVVEPIRRATVPVNFRTDGRWIWTDATTYYLREHHLAPDPGLLAHVRERRATPSTVDGVALHRAKSVLRELPA